MTRCDICHALLDLGDWPFCPHGRSQATVARDEADAALETLEMTITPRLDGFRVPPDGEPHT